MDPEALLDEVAGGLVYADVSLDAGQNNLVAGKARQPGVEVIYANVLIDGNKKPRWVGDGEEVPANGGINFQGKWTPDMTDVPMYLILISMCLPQTLVSGSLASGTKRIC